MTSLRDEKLIGLTCAGLLAALLLPLPLILAHTSPDATIGERYTAAYAALLALYVGATVGWAVVTA